MTHATRHPLYDNITRQLKARWFVCVCELFRPQSQPEFIFLSKRKDLIIIHNNREIVASLSSGIFVTICEFPLLNVTLIYQNLFFYFLRFQELYFFVWEEPKTPESGITPAIKFVFD